MTSNELLEFAADKVVDDLIDAEMLQADARQDAIGTIKAAMQVVVQHTLMTTRDMVAASVAASIAEFGFEDTEEWDEAWMVEFLAKHNHPDM